nr:SWIM zinc finger family protein [Planctomycetota bacterium]
MPRAKTARRKSRTVQQVEAVTLSESAIQKHIDEKSLARGKKYHRDRAIFGAYREGNRLKARCRGSYSNSYHVEATIQDGRILNADCSCPAGEGGHCKHVAALLLTWKDAAGSFAEVGNVREMLREQSKADLLDLIGLLIDREPELELLIAQMMSGEATDVEPYRQMAAAAFEGIGSENPSRIGLEAALAAVRAIGDRFAVRGDARSSSVVYRGLLEGVMAQGTDHPDLAYESTCELIEVLSGSAVALATCLKSLPQEHPERASLTETLAEWLGFDLRLGGIGLADGVVKAYARHSTKEDRVELAERLEELSDDLDDSDWADERVAEWLLELEDADFD